MCAQIQNGAPLGSASTQVRGRRVCWRDAGDPRSHHAAVLVHAFPVGAHLWQPQLDAWPEWRVVAPALPGFDGSDPLDEPSVDAYALHLLAFLDELRIQRAVFCGVSMGGYVLFGVLRHAASRVAGLVFADTRSTADAPEALDGRHRMLRALEAGGAAAVAKEMLPKLLGKTTRERRPDLVESVRRMIEAQTIEGLRAAIHVLMSRPDSTPLLHRIGVPTLGIVGEEDTLTPPREMDAMVAAVPSATSVSIPHAGHLANLENPAAFNAAVARFLRSTIAEA